jgi:hypothetical protein
MDGELSTDEWMINKCGITGEPDITEKYILIDSTLYLKGKKDIYSILEAIGKYYQPEKEYDFIANKGYGSEQAYTRENILGKKGAFVITDPEWLKEVNIKSYSQFKKDYPKFNETEYMKIQKSLDYYFENMNK